MSSTKDCKVLVTFNIQNTGKLAGATEGQVYVHQCRPSVEKPNVELAGCLMDESQAVEETESGQHLSNNLVSIYNAMIDLNKPMRPHMQEMYGIAPIEDASEDEEVDEA
jgi:hypothetical protein